MKKINFVIIYFYLLLIISNDCCADVIQLPSVSQNNQSISLYDGTIAWMGTTTNGITYQIYYWNGYTTTQISNSSEYDFNHNVSLSNGAIAWVGKRDRSIMSADLLYWDGSRTIQVSTGSDEQRPSLSYGSIAWWHGGTTGISFWNGTSITVIPGSSSYLDIISNYNGTVTWPGWVGGQSTIMYWDGSTTRVIGYGSDPSLYSGTIAWTAGMNFADIMYWDGSTTRVIGYGSDPSLYNGTIAWRGSDGQIYYWDGSITRSIGYGSEPSLYNGTIAWRGTDAQVYYWDGGNIPPPSAVPEPITTLLLGLGLVGLAAIRKRIRN